MLKPIFALAVAIVLTCVLGGCAVNDALSEESAPPDPQKPLVVMVLRLQNKVEPQHQAWAGQMILTNNQTQQETKLRLHPPEIREDNAYVEHLIAFTIEPGTYTISQIDCARDLVVENYKFTVRSKFQFQASPATTTYIGHLHVSNRLPREGEKPTGDVWPLIGQSVSGYGRGVNESSITNRSAQDIPLLTKTYGFLASRKVEVKPMAAVGAKPTSAGN